MIRFFDRNTIKNIYRARVLVTRPILEFPLPQKSCYGDAGQRSWSEADPRAHWHNLFTFIHQQEAGEEGKFIDFHDLGGLPASPPDPEIIVSNAKKTALQARITRELNIPELFRAASPDAKEVDELVTGLTYGDMYRVVVPFVAGYQETRWGFNLGEPAFH
jgi:hypothetical protein